MAGGYWQYLPARRAWWRRAIDAVRDIPYLVTDAVAADEGWRTRAVFALFLLLVIAAGAVWLVGFAIRGFHVG